MPYSVQTEIFSQTQLCQRLRHLSQFSSHLLLVSGEPGAGKSTLAQQYSCTDFNQNTIFLAAQRNIADVTVREQLLQQLSYDGRFNAHLSLTDSLVALAAQCSEELTLVIDDGHWLSAAMISEFTELLESCLQNRINIRINIILFAEPQWVTTSMSEFAGTATHILELEVMPLDPQAARDFVAQQFAKADYQPTFVNQDALQRQIDTCQGNPAALIACANAIMAGEVYNPTGATPEAPQRATDSGNKSFYLAALMALVLVLGVGISLLFDDASKTLQVSTDATSAIGSNSLAAEPGSTTEPAERSDTTSNDNAVLATTVSDDEPQLLASNWDEELPTQVDKTITLTDARDSAASASKQRIVVDDATVNKMLAQQHGNTAQQAPPAAETNVAVPVAKPSAAPQSLTGKAWVMAQPAVHYTFQIAGLSRPAQLQQYLSEHKLADNIWTYQTQRNGKPWYVILYGSFASTAAANTAKAKLPAAVQQDRPWLKTFGQIQRDL